MDQEVLLNVILEKLQSLESRLESRLQSSSDGCAKILDEMGK